MYDSVFDSLYFAEKFAKQVIHTWGKKKKRTAGSPLLAVILLTFSDSIFSLASWRNPSKWYYF